MAPPGEVMSPNKSSITETYTPPTASPLGVPQLASLQVVPPRVGETEGMSEWDLSDAVEFVPNRLYWVTLNAASLPKNSAKSGSHYFSVDRVFVYEPFFQDFGPLNLGHTYRYCKMLDEKLNDPRLKGKRIIHCCSAVPRKRTNAAYLICAYMVIVQRKTAEEAFEPFKHIYPPLLAYRDASASRHNLFELTVLDCLRGLEVSIKTKLFDWDRFNAESYEFFAKVENGDLNWILPEKFLAFAGPFPSPADEDGFPAFTPEDYAPVFLDAGIRLVIRLNRKTYDKQRFIDHGIKHADLYFADGTCPSGDIINRFLRITESEPGPSAVHCKAGLGRTGTLIGLYAMKHYRFPARAFIGWNRICRPGSILGPQQQFLIDMEQTMFQAGEMMGSVPLAPSTVNMVSPYAPGLGGVEGNLLLERMAKLHLNEEGSKEDVGQGEGLCQAKRSQLLATLNYAPFGQQGPLNGGAFDQQAMTVQPSNGYAYESSIMRAPAHPQRNASGGGFTGYTSPQYLDRTAVNAAAEPRWVICAPGPVTVGGGFRGEV